MHWIFIALQLTCPALKQNEACYTAYKIWIGENYKVHQLIFVNESHLNRTTDGMSWKTIYSLIQLCFDGTGEPTKLGYFRRRGAFKVYCNCMLKFYRLLYRSAMGCTSPDFTTELLCDYALHHNWMVSGHCSFSILTIINTAPKVGTMNHTGQPYVGSFDIWTQNRTSHLLDLTLDSFVSTPPEFGPGVRSMASNMFVRLRSLKYFLSWKGC